MQSKDIKVGTDYAFQAYGRRGHHYPEGRERVTVTHVNADHTVYNNWGRPTLHRNVVIFTYATGSSKGETGFCKPEKIVHTWSEEHAERTTRGKWQAEYKRAEQTQRAKRARLAYAVHTALVEKGAKVGLGYTYDDEDFAALLEAGFEEVKGDEMFRGSHVHSAVNHLSTLMEKGTVEVAQVAFLLGVDAEVPEPEDSLDNYDLDED